MIVLSARIGGRGRRCVSEVSMENACGINSIMKRGMLHAPKERKCISKEPLLRCEVLFLNTVGYISY
jgi:hypothetical protein